MEERITKILLESFKAEHEAIGSDTTFAELGFDSILITELALVLDNEFGTAFEDGELADTMTISKAAELVTLKAVIR
jgi:acyl carrier protein